MEESPPRAVETPGAAPPAARVEIIAGLVVLVLLAAVCLGLAFRGGAYGPAEWLPFLIGVTALAVMLAAAGPTLRCTRLQWVAFALFAAQALWTAASLLWASSRANAWEETNRTLLYAVGVVVVVAAVRWSGPRGLKVLAALLTAVVGIMALIVAVRLGTSDDPAGFFSGGRLTYPVTYYNGQACLLMLGFWLALGSANGFGGARSPHDAPERAEARGGLARIVQPLLLIFAVLFLELALLPQSRGALWTTFLVAPFFVIFSSNRFRALVDLVIVAVPVVLFWSRMNAVYAAVRDGTSVDAAVSSMLRAVGLSVLIVIAAWLVTWVVERMLAPLSRRVIRWVAVVLVVLALAGLAAGLVYTDHRTGGLGDHLSDRWKAFTSDQNTGSVSESRFTSLGLSGRPTHWKVAAKAFEEHPLLGVGAQNFEVYWCRHRSVPVDVRQPHSLSMRLLAELGLPGLILWVTFVLLALVRAAVLRFRTRARADQAVLAAMITAALSWFIHSSADWLWQLAAVSLPAMMLFGGLVAAGGSAAPQPAASRPAWRRWTTRPILAVLALAVLVSAALPYLSLRYCDTAAGARDVETMLARTNTAASLDPTSVQPFAVRANAYKTAADQAPEGSPARTEHYRLAAEAWVDATEREPDGWLYHFKAGEMFLAARDAAIASGAATAEELGRAARSSLDEARRLNPLSRQIDALEKDF
ncbi:MAG: O-antigen ligase family protein [Armatimonadetes bacterium]|nr:O-antigen ligase family protein [Armatimonadota bacterium]